MQEQSISGWMKSSHYGLPIMSRPARTAARFFRPFVGSLVIGLLVFDLAHLVLLTKAIPWPLVGLTAMLVLIYLAYLVLRANLPTMLRASSGSWPREALPALLYSSSRRMEPPTSSRAMGAERLLLSRLCSAICTSCRWWPSASISAALGECVSKGNCRQRQIASRWRQV